MKTTPKISLLLHNYNHADLLHRCLSAIQNQTEQAYEVLILDDGSTDGSVEIIESYVSENLNFKFYKNLKNMGILYSVNKLLTLATGDFIISTASDDILLPGFIKRYLLAATTYPNVALIHSCGANFSTQEDVEESLKLDKFKLSNMPIISNVTHYSPKDFVKTCKDGYITICSNTVMCSRQLLIDYGGFDDALRWHTDWFAFYSIALRHNSIMLNEYLTLYHISDDSYHKKGMRDPIQQTQVINAIFNKILQPYNHDLFKCFKVAPALLTLFDPKMLLRCSLMSKNNLAFLIPTVFYFFHKPKQYFNLKKQKVFLYLQLNHPSIYRIAFAIKYRFKLINTR